MTSKKLIRKLKQISISRLKEEVREIRAQLPEENQRIITYSKNFTLSLSNYCQNNCGYCYYNHRIPKSLEEDNITLISEDQIKFYIDKALKFNCKEALLMSGENPDSFQIVKEELKNRNYRSFLEFVKNLSRKLLKQNLLPHTNIGVLSFEELKKLKELNASMGLMLESSCQDLYKQGGVHEHSPSKIPEIRIKYIENAGKLKIPFTTGLLLGIRERLEDRIKDLYIIKDLYQKFGHIQEVIIQNYVYKKGVPYIPREPLRIEEILRIVGIAKIIFQNDIPIQVPPNLISGYELDFIEVGIDDFGGISPFTQDYVNPEKPWPQIDYLNEICKKRDYKLKERLPIYDKYIEDKKFSSDIIKQHIEKIKINDA